MAEPVEHRDVAEGDRNTACRHGHVGCGEKPVEELVPEDQLIGSGPHVGDGEGAVGIARRGVHGAPAHHGDLVHPDPAVGNGAAMNKGEIGRARHMLVHHPAGDGCRAVEHGRILDVPDEADVDVVAGGPQFLEERGLVGFHPRVYALGALEGGGLVPPGGGRDRLDGVLAREQVLDDRHAIRSGLDEAAAQRQNLGAAVRVVDETAVRKLLVGGSERIGESILGDLAAGLAIGAARFLDRDAEVRQALFLREAGPAADGLVVLVDEDGNLRRRHRRFVHHDGDSSLPRRNLRAAHLVAAPRQDGDVIALRRIECEIGG